MLDDISQAVLARDEVVEYLRGAYGETGTRARERGYGYLEELRTTQRYGMYRALQHPLYPILRKIERIGENLAQVSAAGREHRLVYVSNHRSHIDYLVDLCDLCGNSCKIIGSTASVIGCLSNTKNVFAFLIRSNISNLCILPGGMAPDSEGRQ